MSKSRPKPETLLAQAEEEERRKKLGKLKIFFGAAPGVGKTHSMLSEALAKRAEGLDVVIGVVESHERAEIKELIKKFEVIPRFTLEYRGKQLQEFDLDSAIKRAPALMLVDEMAHTNIPGVRHSKRWQDINELLERGITVYTTLNVQHIESLNDVIKQITGITVHETVPDSILETADSIELVDLPPEDLLKRLAEGKIYIPRQAELAVRHFFRKSNLSALRELALRFTAERVNAQVQSERRDLAEQDIWPTSERILVCLDHTPFSIKLIRTAKRMSASFRTEWQAVYVDSPRIHISEEERQNAIQNLRFAEQMGAETSILMGYDIVDEIIQFAKTHNITKLIIGKMVRPRWHQFLFKDLSDQLIRNSGSIDVYIITTEKSQPHVKRESTPVARPLAWKEYTIGIVTSIVATILTLFIYPFTKQTNIILIYLLSMIFVATRGNLAASILTFMLSFFAYVLIFAKEPFFVVITSTEFIVIWSISFIVTYFITQLALLAKHQLKTTQLQERRNYTLYHLSRALASHRGDESLLQVAAQHIADVFESKVFILTPDPSGHLIARTTQGDVIDLDMKERSIAQWAFDLGQMAGLGTTTLPFTPALYYPLRGSSGKIAMLRIQPNNPKSFIAPEQLHLLETCARQATLAIEVDRLQEEVRKSELEIEVNGLRSILLTSISNELQIPLSDIQKILKRIIQNLSQINLQESADTIQKYTDQLNRLIEHLVQTLQLEAGVIELKKEPYSLEKIIKSALNKSSNIIKNKPLFLHIPGDLPLIPCDKNLIMKVIVNLIENAVKYTSIETPLDVLAKLKDHWVTVSIADKGDGILSEDVERIFDKFYRGQIPPKNTGAGLGLFICRSIVQLHGGKIWAESRPGGGTVFTFVLPLDDVL